MRKLLLVSACLLAATVIAGCGSDDDTTTETTGAPTTESTTTESTTTETTTTDTTPPAGPTVIRIVVENGAPEGGIVRETVDQGERVVLVVQSDVADEVHLHGYDVSREVRAGGTARLPFEATIPGRFEVELEERGVQIADVTVEP